MNGNYSFLSSTINGNYGAVTVSGAYNGKKNFLSMSFYATKEDNALSLFDRYVFTKNENTRQVFKNGFLREEPCGLFHTNLKLQYYVQDSIASHSEAEAMIGFRFEKNKFKNVSFYLDLSGGIYTYLTGMRNYNTGNLFNFNIAYDVTLGMNVKNRFFLNLSAVSETDFYIPYVSTLGVRGELLLKLNDFLSLGFEDNLVFNDFYFNRMYVTRHERTIFFVWRKRL
ncbi:MAG: hypothetical protein K6G51_06575 [Sphaerochaetaceae bacterium]|nr:hypothetical protein [Sphaerochaetaceae bacterium]